MHSRQQKSLMKIVKFCAFSGLMAILGKCMNYMETASALTPHLKQTDTTYRLLLLLVSQDMVRSVCLLALSLRMKQQTPFSGCLRRSCIAWEENLRPQLSQMRMLQ